MTTIQERVAGMLEGIPILNLTAPTLLLVVVLFFMLGKIYPEATLKEKRAEAERWRKAYEAEREARITANAQTEDLLELAKTTHSLISALFANSEQIKRETGESDVASIT